MCLFVVDQPQVKGAHVRFKKLVQIGELWIFRYYEWFFHGKSHPHELLFSDVIRRCLLCPCCSCTHRFVMHQPVEYS